MGISGLLPLLKSIHKHCSLKKFAGQTIGIDGYGWLHRGSVACAIELALDKPTTKYVDFAVSRVRMLLDFGIIPYVVFDGDALPSKAGTNAERRKKRDEAKAYGLQLYKAGQMSQAYQELQKAAGVTPQMARQLIEELRKMNVQYIVAPYEADAQLAYLEQKGIINGVLSEDSDLLVFGTKRLITKLNQYGECIEIERSDFPLCKDISLTGWSDAMFRRMAILSGCDYLPNIDKMGLKTAYRFIRKYKDAEKAIRMIALEGKFVVPQDYYDKFKKAELTFLHHRVFCPIEQRMVFLTDLERGMNEDEMSYLGAYVEPETAIAVACGDLNPKTKKPLDFKAHGTIRPALKENRRQTFGTPSELKQGKSIEAFFKAQRTPLAELDPNSLTPSPSQQRLLERNQNASWQPRPVSSAPQLRRTRTGMDTPPAVESSDRRAFLARAAMISSYQPPKRQRLCSEFEDVSPSKEVKQSPFFTSAAPLVRPLDLKKTRNRKGKREFDVWSDDSVDDIIAGLVDVQQVASPEGLTGIHYEETTIASKEVDSAHEAVPQSSPTKDCGEASFSALENRESDTQTTFAESGYVSQDVRSLSVSADDNLDAFEDLLEYHVRKQNASLAKTFVAQPGTIQQSALASLQSPSSANVSLNKSAENEPDCDAATPRQSPKTTAAVLKTFAYQSPEQQAIALQSLKPVQSTAAKIKYAKAAVAQKSSIEVSSYALASTNSVSLEPQETDTVTYPNLPRITGGSEDAIIPNSEDEISEGEDGALRPAIDFRAFLFQP